MRNYPVSKKRRAMIDLRWCDPFPGGRKALMGIMLDQMGLTRGGHDPVDIARQLVGTGRYKLEARCSEAPSVVDCSSLMRWVFSFVGILLPRASIDQLAAGYSIPRQDVASGDLIFTTGPQNFFTQDQSSGVGHVGLVTEAETVIEASPGEHAVKEVPLLEFLQEPRCYRGAARILPPLGERFAVQLKPEHEDIHYCKDILRFAQKLLPLRKESAVLETPERS